MICPFDWISQSLKIVSGRFVMFSFKARVSLMISIVGLKVFPLVSEYHCR